MFFRKTMLSAIALMAFPMFASAEQGVTTDSVTFAQVAAFEGPAAALGNGMRLGITAAFEEANASGGVHGRMLKLDSMDDGYEPDRSASLVKGIVEANNHLGLIGAVGTPTSSATQPIATEANMPFIGPFTGAGFLRDASHGNIFNVRATYFAETEAWIDYLVDQQGMSSIALLYQDDGFGRVGLNGVNAALEKRGMSLAAEGTYTRNTTAVKKALLAIRKSNPDAVVMVGAYKPVAEFIKLARKMKMTSTFVNISFVGSDALSTELGDAGEGVIISQVVPFPWDISIPVVAQYTEALKAADVNAKPGFVSLEGYIVGRLAIAGLEAAGQDLTRDNYLEAMRNLTTLDLGGVTMTFGSEDNQGMDDVFLTRITADGSFESIVPGGGS
ncbi:ABC transporter substrate-binding protein [Leisingera daeponensis]|uniref:ABC transporter substrate-binding protein n=1 Tax=Leisingera daeponensis TaxID=405746 RepID=UPI0003F4F4B1|nr:ABC transporter substrate-binding protein [Leisingera daeponensis]